MKAANTLHPLPETLQAFGLGKLDDFSNEPVLRHLETCPACRRFVADFKDGGGDSGVQIRSKIITPKTFTVAGPQGVMAEGFWGSLYGELFGNGGKGEMMKAAPKARVANAITNKGDFVDYYIKCVGKHVTIRLNGLTTVDDDFPTMPAEGIIALQLHRGGPMEVTFRNIQFMALSSKQ
jgi:hypothetical protein